MPLRFIEDELIMQLMQKGYTLASRHDMEALTREMQFQNSGLTQADAARLGRLLNVPAILLVEVTYLSNNGNAFSGYQPPAASLSARLIQVESGEILWASSASYQAPSSASGNSSFYANVQVGPRFGYGYNPAIPWMAPQAAPLPGYQIRNNQTDATEMLRVLAARIAAAFPAKTAVPYYR